jgi:hypothetical protein
LKRAKEIATEAVARPWDASRASEQVVLHNLLAMFALLNGDHAEADVQFSLTDAIPDAQPAAHGVIELSRSFLAVAARRTADAERHYRGGKALTASVQLPGWSARLSTPGALIAWSRGDLVRTEALLRAAIAEMPQDEAPRAYLAQLLEARGDSAGATAERVAAADGRRFDTEIPAQAQSLFWVDPVHGGLKRRG